MGRTRTSARIATALALLLASLSAGAVQAADPSAGGFYVATFRTRITDATRAHLARTGVEIIGYEPDDAYIVSATEREVAAARRLHAIASVTPVAPARKLGTRISTGRVDVDVITSGTDLASDGVVHAIDAVSGLATVRLNVDAEGLRALATRHDVLFIEPALARLYTEDEKTTQTIAGNIGDDKRSVPGYLEWLEQANVDGKGITVSIVDTGINESHPDLAGRVVKTIDYGDGPIQETPYDTGGHGTHVAGIVGGLPSGSGLTYEDPDGFLYGMGVAPQVKFVNQNILGLFAPSWGGAKNYIFFRRVAGDAYEAGSRAWNASWHTGQGNRAGYLAPAREFDMLTRDVVPKTGASEEFLFVFSAGNAGASGPTVPKEAKNIIAVGSTKSGRGIHWPQTSDPETISSFSSQGPTKDGRIFPTISAPGENVISARSNESTFVVCPIDGYAYYCFGSGTSMAAPHVTGSAALIQQWWKREHGGLPSPAMVKALLVNTATDIGIPDIPNNFEGWGRITLDPIFDRKAPPTALDQTTTFHTTEDDFSFSVGSDSKAPLKITLGWSDAAATVGAEKALVNDLDLVVERLNIGPSGTDVVEVYRGNVFENGASKPGGKADRLNNLENVYLRKPSPGIYRITISVANLPGDGVPNNGDTTDQDFALVITGDR